VEQSNTDWSKISRTIHPPAVWTQPYIHRNIGQLWHLQWGSDADEHSRKQCLNVGQIDFFVGHVENAVAVGLKI